MSEMTLWRALGVLGPTEPTAAGARGGVCSLQHARQGFHLLVSFAFSLTIIMRMLQLLTFLSKFQIK